MIDLTKDKLITFAEVAAMLPPESNGKRLTPKTVAAWANVGKRGVRLETVKPGRTPFTTAQAVSEFLTNLASGGVVQVARKPVSTKGRERSLSASIELLRGGRRPRPRTSPEGIN